MILLQFSGTQDIDAFGKVCEAINDLDMNWSGGSHEFRIGVKDGKILFANYEDFEDKKVKGGAK